MYSVLKDESDYAVLKKMSHILTEHQLVMTYFIQGYK